MIYGKRNRELLAQPTERCSQGQSPWRAGTLFGSIANGLASGFNALSIGQDFMSGKSSKIIFA